MKLQYLFQRKTREQLGDIKENIKNVLSLDSSKRKYFKSYFHETRSIFIHIPKCAGTSISIALYGEDPWHHSIKKYLTDSRSDAYLKFAVVREPVSRFVSIYQYLVSNAFKYPDSIYTDASNCVDINEFFSNFVENIDDKDRNYFLRSQWYYVSDESGNIAVDYLINMQTIDDDFDPLRKHFNFYEKFPKRNEKVDKRELVLTDELRDRILQVYREDIALLRPKIKKHQE